MQTILRTGFHNQVVIDIRACTSKTLLRSVTPGRQRTVARSSIISNSGAVERLRQSKDSWRLIAAQNVSEVVPRILLVDGTNLACLCAGGRHKSRSVFSERVEDRFASWLRFLQYYTQACTVLVAFDNKGSATTNVRAQLVPSYLRRRYTPAAAGGGGDLNGWAHLGAVVKQLNDSCNNNNQQQQQQQGDGCYLIANAAYGYEADDVLAAAAHWVSEQLQPRPLVLVCSSDSDMQQLLDTHTYWLELMQVASKSHPSGLQLHSAAAFTAAAGYPAPLYADYLSLVGKTEASVPGLGVTARLARTLLQKVGPVEAIISAGQSGGLKQYGAAADKLFSSSSSEQSVSANHQQLLTNKGIFKLYGQQQVPQLPQQQLQACYAAALQTLHQQEQQEFTHSQTAASAAAAAQHPAISAHMLQSKPYLDQLSSCLQTLGLKHKVGFLTANGHWCDIMIEVHCGSSSSSSSNCQQHEQQQWDPEPKASSSDWLAVQLLSPADLSNGPGTTFTSVSSSRSNNGNNSQSDCYDMAVDQLAQLLADRCGCFVQGDSALGHAKRRLLEFATGAAKRRLSLVKAAGWKVAVVPFYELHLAALEETAAAAAAPGDNAVSAAAAASASERDMATAAAAATTTAVGGALLGYVLALLQEQCGPTWKPPSLQQARQ